jgi:predicted porin
MHKHTILAAALAACAGTAFGQSSVTLFGAVDAGFSHYKVDSHIYNATAVPAAPPAGVDTSRSQTSQSSSNTTPSRFGLRGVEDLGDGLSAGFWLEGGITPSTGAGFANGALNFNRRATVSLSSSRWGELRLGRDNTVTFWNDTLFNPFGTVGVATNVISTVGSNLQLVRGPGSPTAANDNYMRTNNAIGYVLPRGLGGWYGQLQFARQDQPVGTSSAKGRFVGGRVGHAAGPWDFALAYAESVSADGAVLANGAPTGALLNEKVRTLSLGGTYDFGPVKLWGQLSQVWDAARRTPAGSTSAARDTDKYRGASLGATAPMGAGLFKLAYGRVDFDDAFGLDARVDKFAIGYEYNLSRRTAVYATAARIRVSDGQNNPAILGALPGGTPRYLSTGNNTVGFAPSRGTGYDIGLRHVF